MLDLPYIPDLDRLFATYNQVVDNTYDQSIFSNPYFSFLLNHQLIHINDKEIIANDNFKLSDNENRNAIFLEFLGSQVPESKLILDFISYKPKDIHEIVKHFEGTLTDNAARVLTAWLEHLKEIVPLEGKYSINENLTQDDVDSDSIYPLSLDNPLDIKEEKYSVFEYLRKVNSKQVLLDPEFQRNLVWKPEQKSKFIESALLQLPIPPLYLKKRNDGKLLIIDGLQRTTALSEYLSDKFKLIGLEALTELNDKSFDELKKNLKTASLPTRIEDKQLLFYVLGPNVPMRIVYDLFNRINTGGTRLERQEVRNCVFIGNSTKLLKELAQDEIFKKAVDNGISDKRMKAREAILRCIAFVLFPIEDYQGSMDDFLENTMKKMNTMSAIEIDDLKYKTLNTFRQTYEIFGKHNFRIPTESSRGRINIALMEAVFNCFWERDNDKLSDKAKLNEKFNNLVHQGDFIYSFKMSTGSKSGVKTRFTEAHKYLDYD